MLQEDLQALEARYKEKLPLLQDAERKKNQIVKRLKSDTQKLTSEVSDKVYLWMKDQTDNLSKWAKEYQPENIIEFFSGKTTWEQAKPLIREVSEFLQGRLQEEQDKWRAESLIPLLQEGFTEMTESIETEVGNLLTKVDDIRASVAGVSVESLKPDDGKELKPLERVLAAAGGFVVGGIGSALVGAFLGYKAMAQSLVPQFALVLGMIALGVTNPLVFVVALLAGGGFQGWLTANSTTEKIKMKVADEMGAKIRESSKELGEQVAEQVRAEAGKFIEAVDKGLDREIGGVREQVEQVLADKRQGNQRVEARLAALREGEVELMQISSELTQMLCDLAKPRDINL